MYFLMPIVKTSFSCQSDITSQIRPLKILVTRTSETLGNNSSKQRTTIDMEIKLI